MPDPDLDGRQDRIHTLVQEFRANGGRLVSGPLAGRPLLLLTTRDAWHGKPGPPIPLGYITFGDSWVVFASNAGRPARPTWYHNLLANAEAEIEVGTERVEVVAEQAKEPELSELWARVMMAAPFVKHFRETAPGPTPVFILSRKDSHGAPSA